MSSIFNNKRGELTDILIWLITLFILAVGLFIFMYIIPAISGGLRTAGLNNTVEGTNAINSIDTIGTGTINYGFLILFVGLSLSVLITSFLVRTSPIFLFLYIIFLGITIILSFYLGNTYELMRTNPIFSSVLSNGNFINLVMGHIAEITLAVAALSFIVLFSKFSSYGGDQQF